MEGRAKPCYSLVCAYIMTHYDPLPPFRHGRGIPPLPSYRILPRPYRKRYRLCTEAKVFKPHLKRFPSILPFLNASLVNRPEQHYLRSGWQQDEVRKRVRRLLCRTWTLEEHLKGLQDSL